MGTAGAHTESAPAAGTLSPRQEFSSWLLARAGGKEGGWAIGLGVPRGWGGWGGGGLTGEGLWRLSAASPGAERRDLLWGSGLEEGLGHQP